MFYFTEFTEIIPLFNCNERGKGQWKKAYQSIKHDRVNSIKKANIKNLLLTIGALYILNLYYSGRKYTRKQSDIAKNDFDLRLNSNIFSVKYFDATKIRGDRNKKISFDVDEITVRKECIYIKKHSDEWVKKISDSFVNNNLFQMQSLANEDYDLELVLNKNQRIYNI